MNIETIAKARQEAKRFLAAANAVEKAAQADRMVFLGSPATAALRRASMDLTRALADLRRTA
jgi:methylaspartate ammonia-lyase